MGSNPHPGSLKDFLITASTGYSGAHAPDIPPDRSLRCVRTGVSGLLDQDARFKTGGTCMLQDEQVLRYGIDLG